MFGLVMLAKVFARAVEASFHRGDTGSENFGDFGVAASFLDEREQRAVLRTELRERVTQGIQFLRIDRAGWFWNVFVLLAERQENPPQLLAAQLIDAGVAREPEQPRLELRRRLQAIERTHHLDEDLLREVLDVVTSAGHGVNESGDPMLVADNELPLGRFVALLGTTHEVGQSIR